MRDGTMAPWCRADAAPLLKSTQVDGASDLTEDVNGGALTLAFTVTASSGAVDLTVVDDGDELDQVREQHVREEGNAVMGPAQKKDIVVDGSDRTPSPQAHPQAQEQVCHTAADTMGTEGKLPPKQRKRKRSPSEPRTPSSEPRAKRGPGKAADAPNTQTPKTPKTRKTPKTAPVLCRRLYRLCRRRETRSD